jgi:hypothetical protein
LPKGNKPPGGRTPGARTCWIEKGTTDDRNRINRSSDNGATGSFSAVVAQPQVGLRPGGWCWHDSAGRRRAGASRATVTHAPAISAPARLAGFVLSWRWAMNDSKQRVVKFLEKEIKTYAALSLFLSKKSTLVSVNVRDKQVLMHPAFYKERMKEARKLVTELKKSN